MSLFTVLKYPISDPPKASELEALPEEIYSKWIRHTAHWPMPGKPFNTPIAQWFRSFRRIGVLNPQDEEDLKLLRKIIREWDK